MTETTHRITVVGAGLAGLTLVDALLRQGASPGSIALLDGADAKRGSDNPGATFHPFPGSSVAPEPRKLRAAHIALETIDRWASRWDDPPIRRFAMARPLEADERSDRLRASFDAAADYPDWLEMRRLEGAELSELEPDLSDWSEALVYRPARSVDLPALRTRLLESFDGEGVDVRTSTLLRSLRRDADAWVCRCTEDRLRSDRVVLAVGRGMGTWFPELAMECRGGELLVTEADPGAEWSCAVHAGGHVAPSPGGGLVAGATWWPPESYDERADREARTEIASACRRIVPDLADRPGRIWRGVRSGFGDYQPLVGPIPGTEGLHAMGGFGGTGLFSIPHHASSLATLLLGGEDELPRLSRPDRMNADKWRPAPDRFAGPEQTADTIRQN